MAKLRLGGWERRCTSNPAAVEPIPVTTSEPPNVLSQCRVHSQLLSPPQQRAGPEGERRCLLVSRPHRASAPALQAEHRLAAKLPTAAAVAAIARRPALAHWLWVLVLIKLVTPPLVLAPLGLASRRLRALNLFWVLIAVLASAWVLGLWPLTTLFVALPIRRLSGWRVGGWSWP